jgi:hypothetical protein
MITLLRLSHNGKLEGNACMHLYVFFRTRYLDFCMNKNKAVAALHFTILEINLPN